MPYRTLLVATILVGCASGVPGTSRPDVRPSPDAGGPRDAGAPWDAGPADGGSDGGGDVPTPPRDAPIDVPVDARAGAPTDAPRDAGPAPDAPGCACGRLESCVGATCVPFPSCAGSSVCAPGAHCRSGLCVPADRDLDGDGATAATDCDENDARVRPGAVEACNGRDDDCDGAVDPAGSAGAPTFYRDADGDGYGSTATSACTMPAGHVAAAGDCDDGDAWRRPGLAERCDSLDNDCDGAADEAGCLAGCYGALRGAAAYFVCTGARSWDAARGGCEGRGAHLARVDDNAENNWIRSQVDARGLASVWLGGSDTATEGRWVWSDGARFWTGAASGTAFGAAYTRWSAGEPNDDGGEDCLELEPDRSWNDDECTTSQGFVCEY